MLVYFVNHSTAPVNLGGAERSMIALVEDWMERDPDFQPFFLTKAPRGRFIDAIEQRGWPYLALRFRGWALPDTRQRLSRDTYFARDDYEATLRMIAAMDERRPQLVVTNTVVAPWGAFAAKALGIPHAWFIREYGDLDHGLVFSLGREKTFEDIGLLSEAVFVNSLALREHVAPYIDDEKLGVVYPRIDLHRVRALAKQLAASAPFKGADATRLRVTMVGRLSDSKGQKDVVAALALLRDRSVDVELCLVGASEPPGYERALSAQARRLGVEDLVTFAGERANPYPYIAAADVCVTASGIEAFGRTTLEYLALARPVVATGVGGSVELVDATAGALYPSGDVAALAAALEGYARDTELITAHGHGAFARARAISASEFSNDAAIDRMLATASAPAYRLPNAARYWFSLPQLYYSTGGRGPRILASVVLARARARVVRLMRGRHSR